MAGSLIDRGMPGQHVPARRRPSSLLAILRIVTGLAAIAGGALLAPQWLATAPLATLGLLLVLGLAPRLVALVLLAVVLAIVATIGRVDGGVALFGGAVLAVALLVLVARGGGAGALLDRVDPA
jgi:uncharacterized membrane protein YphA (DoxX/SURF4 family)